MRRFIFGGAGKTIRENDGNYWRSWGRVDEPDVLHVRLPLWERIRFEGVPPAYLVMSRQLGMRFSRFEANILATERSELRYAG